MDALEITVVIPAFNAEAHVSRAIQSARALGVSEVIVVDDGSADGTASLAHALGCRVLSQPNRGAAFARIAGVEVTATPYVILLDADDELNLAGFHELLTTIGPEVAWAGIHGSSLCIASDGSTRRMGLWSEGVTLDSLLRRGICPGPAGSFLWRTEALNAVMRRSTTALWPRFGEDYEMLLRVAMYGGIEQHTAVICNYTLSGGKSAISPFRDNVAAERVRRYYADMNGISIRKRRLNEIKGMAHLRDAYALPGKAHFVAKSWHFLQAIRLAPLMFPQLIINKITRPRQS